MTTLTRDGVTGSALYGSPTTTSPLENLLTQTPAQPDPTIAPKAGINWILFNDQFVPVNMGTDLVSSSGDEIKSHADLNIPMTSNGYLYVYASNESNIDVFFDNLQVVQTRGPILEETHYYPVGLVMEGISDQSWAKLPNYRHFQSMEMQNHEFSDGTGLGELDFGARYYDQQLGRWHNQDPASQFVNPYLGMSNNWPNGIDPYGMNFWSSLGIVAEDVGAMIALGPVAYFGAVLESTGHFNVDKWDNNWWKGAITADVVAAAAVIGFAEIAAPSGATSILGMSTPISQIAEGAATGVGQGIISTEFTSVSTTGHLSWNWGKMFVGTVSGAITGALASKPISNFIDRELFGTQFAASSIFKGSASFAVGSVITTGFKESDARGWSLGHFFDGSTQWPALAEGYAAKLTGNIITKYDPLNLPNDFGGLLASTTASKLGGAVAQQIVTNIINNAHVFQTGFNASWLLNQYIGALYKTMTTPSPAPPVPTLVY